MIFSNGFMMLYVRQIHAARAARYGQKGLQLGCAKVEKLVEVDGELLHLSNDKLE